MLRKCVFTAVLCAAVAAGAQATDGAGQQQNPPQPRPGAQTEPRATAQGPTTTLVGCVYRERDVPGRSPNIAERAGILEDYILADAKMSGQDATTPSPESTPGAAGTAGTAASMYKLEHVDDERLRAMVGKRVEVTGRIDAKPGDSRGQPTGAPGTEQPDKSPGPDQIELPELEVTSIREVAGTCPPTPAVRK